MASRKPFLLRVRPELLEGLRAWAEQDMRSLNGQIEFLLREALRKRGWKPAATEDSEERKEEPLP